MRIYWSVRRASLLKYEETYAYPCSSSALIHRDHISRLEELQRRHLPGTPAVGLHTPFTTASSAVYIIHHLGFAIQRGLTAQQETERPCLIKQRGIPLRLFQKYYGLGRYVIPIMADNIAHFIAYNGGISGKVRSHVLTLWCERVPKALRT